MSLLPTAHAGQSFGARRIDFYTVSGEVAASDDSTGRVTDTDGITHDVRLLERSNALAPGDTASVLRVQAGPNRRSRPAAIVNHTRGTWMRAGPEATTLLARSGVTRSFNWWLSVLALALVAIAAVWPAIHGFLTEVNGNLMASVPAFDIYAQINASLPGLAGWRLEAALPSGLLDAIASLGFVPMAQLTEWGVGVGAGLLALLAFLGRSWRLVYIPALAALALAAGTVLGSALATLAVVGGSLGLFTLGGLINRIRDGGRFNARVARLAEHALRNPPQEGVRTSDTPDTAAASVAAGAAIAAATATAEGETPDHAPDDTAIAARAGDPSSEAPAGSGEAEAPAQDDLLPAAAPDASDLPPVAESRAPDASGDAEAAPEAGSEEADTAPADADEETVSETDADGVAASDPSNAPDVETGTEDTAEVEGEVPAAAAETEADATDHADAAPADVAPADVATSDEAAETVGADVTPAATDTAETETVAVDNEAASEATVDAEAEARADDEGDDDLPSLDAVAAAAALSAAETTDPEAAPTAETAATVDLDDERTMPVAPPPPMPGAQASAEPVADAGTDMNAEPATQTEASEAGSDVADAPVIITADASETGIVVPAPIVDDPLMEESGDPMVSRSGAGDYAPGAPDIEVDREPAE